VPSLLWRVLPYETVARIPGAPVLAVVVTTVAIASTSWFVLERPIQRRRDAAAAWVERTLQPA
jgi:peptidoglycan/LPS O-acetylase OafA/YrhL